MPTKDGRVIGNAVVFDSVIRNGYFLLIIVTDAGTALDLTPKEVRELFHDPIWIMKVMEHPGVKHCDIWKY